MSEFAYWALEIVLLGMALRDRRTALMVLMFSLPFSRRLPSLPVPLLNFQNLLLLVFIFTCFLKQGGSGKANYQIRHLIPVSFLFVFVTASFLNTRLTFVPTFYPRLWQPEKVAAAFRAAVVCLALYCLVSLAIRTREELHASVKAGILGIITESAYACFEYVVLSPGRVTGHMAEPNSIGAWLAPSLMLLLAFVFVLPRKHPYWRYLAMGSALVAFGLLGSLSRGAWLAAMAGFVVVTAWVSRPALVVGVLLVLGNALWLPDDVKNRIDAILITTEEEGWRFEDGRANEESAVLAMLNEQVAERGELLSPDAPELRLDTSIQVRLVVWTGAFKMMADYPLGVGLGVFRWYLHHYSDVIRWKATHNMFLKIGTELGVPALITFLALLMMFFADAAGLARSAETPEARAFGVGMAGYLVALSVCALSVDVFLQVDVNGQFWCFFGALMRARTLARGKEPEMEAGKAVEEGPRPLYELVS